MGAREIVIVRSASLAKTHRMDTAYAVLGKALCGANVSRARYPNPYDGGADCKRCRELSGEAATTGRR